MDKIVKAATAANPYAHDMVVPVIETGLGRLREPGGDRVEFIVRTDVPA